MKITSVLVVILLFSVQSNAQTMNGKKILSMTMSAGTFTHADQQYYYAGLRQVYRTSELQLTPSAVYGKVNARGLLIAYGVEFNYSMNKSFGTNGVNVNSSHYTSYRIAPMMHVQKFIAMSDKIFFAPVARLSVAYTNSKNRGQSDKFHGLGGAINCNPLSVAFAIRPRTNLLLMAGQLGIDYTRRISATEFPPDSKLHQSTVSIAGSLNYFTLGLQCVI